MMNDWIEIGTVVAPQGLAGEVRVYPHSELPERFLEPGLRWLLSPGQAEPQPIEILGGRYLSGKGLYVVELEGIENREQAEALRDCQLFVKKSDRPHLEEDEFYTLDLIGLEVLNQLDGQILGTVVDVMSAGHDVLEIELSPSFTQSPSVSVEAITADNSSENPHPSRRKKRKPKRKPPQAKKLLVPFVKDIVPVVDLEKRRIEITPPPGLIEL